MYIMYILHNAVLPGISGRLAHWFQRIAATVIRADLATVDGVIYQR
ncbi:hypothetical protein BWQ96_10307 [Gracilariopsis chorda]|uniref:Uncharacterized protein n=1 Tax=Gracilariopsis chorda TaxID=448386 RepID=A0A2V3ID16_9FLOR|nr:hypothetical protein BWQ96_10307 [Gracilariopsis chorda]|eukprot:PXF39979.1 hypothetical protein BWQ96_10307 [Gracilariopsis chorda]